MAECPICGLGERCRNHWVAVQEPSGEVEFQVGAMTASEDNLILLRNKLKNPPLRALFEQIGLRPEWVEEEGRTLAYLAWPLELRGAVHRHLFPNGAPGADNRPLPPTPMFQHVLEEMELKGVALDFVNCLPDEVLYRVRFGLRLSGVDGEVEFAYLQSLWADGIEWRAALASPELVAQAETLIRLLFGGVLDPVRVAFSGQQVTALAEDSPDGLAPGSTADELALTEQPERHLGEELEALVNSRRLQPLLRDSLLRLAVSTPVGRVQ